ncbi:MAG: hypothetical protein F6K56_33950, partial [Moorea sp. SIO3G5]|nr:hypothetical protein [Moorena sp. SIO3G5]
MKSRKSRHLLVASFVPWLNLPMNSSRVGILPARKSIETGKMPVPPRCPFHLTLKIIPLLSNASFVAGAILGCTHQMIPTAPGSEAKPVISRSVTDLIQIEPLPIATKYRNQWTPELESEFWVRANQAIQYYAGKGYGNNYGENEK